MDSITQAVLGAGVQAALLGRWQGRKALLYGAMLGTLPDLDVVIDYGDAVAQMTYHRGFSHSLLVLPLYIPTLIFGAGAVHAAAQGLPYDGHLAALGALAYRAYSDWQRQKSAAGAPAADILLKGTGKKHGIPGHR